MPRRWLSIRTQKESKDAVNVTQDQFDFEFVTDVQDLDSPSTPGKTKPTMFNSPPFRLRRSRNDVSRPQSSSGHKPAVDKRLQLTKVEDSWIGVAFGSPTHPPPAMPRFSCDDSVPLLNRNEATIPSSPLSRCRRLANLFKPRSNDMSISAPTSVCKIDGDQKISMPIARKPWPCPNSPPDWVNATNPEVYTPTDMVTDASCREPLVPPPLRPVRSALPKLEIQIPSIELDRYSVMFSDVSGIKPSNLLERRSRNLNNLRLARNEKTEFPPLPPLKICQAHRPTTPTHQRKASTYSLFPSPPKSRKTSSESSERNLPRRQLSFSRPQTASDSSVSSMLKASPKATGHLATPPRKESDPFSISPDDTIASVDRDDSPWRSNESIPSTPSSRTSVGSEIFFDLKPARDANGREQSQYIIHKPDSPTVELALSKSRKARKAKNRRRDEESVELSATPDLQAAEFMLKIEEKWRLSLELNQAIAEMERLTSPFGSFLPLVDMSDVPPPAPTPPSRELLAPIRLRKKLDGAAIGIPSPITERSEEFSPRVSPKPPVRLQPRQHIASLSIRPAPLSMSISDDSPSPIEYGDFAITPPPVPVKDAKFIPISKFAANGSSVKLVEHHPTKRRKPKRSLTESNISAIPRRSSSTKLKSHDRDRPATISSTVTRSTQLVLSPNPSKRIETGIVAVSVKPMAEVSVARTVSLERKQSHQILLSRPLSRTGDRTCGGPTLSPVQCMSPTFHEGRKAHQPGASLSLVVEKAEP